VHETTILLLVTLSNIHRFKKNFHWQTWHSGPVSAVCMQRAASRVIRHVDDKRRVPADRRQTDVLLSEHCPPSCVAVAAAWVGGTLDARHARHTTYRLARACSQRDGLRCVSAAGVRASEPYKCCCGVRPTSVRHSTFTGSVRRRRSTRR